MKRMAAYIALICLIAGCASCPRENGEAPWYRSTKPTEVVARVDSFRDIGAFIDYPNAFEKYHSVVLVTEGDAGWTRISLQYQGVPILNGRRLELGQRMRFTAPSTAKEDSCCGPYLKDLTDAVFVDAK